MGKEYEYTHIPHIFIYLSCLDCSDKLSHRQASTLLKGLILTLSKEFVKITTTIQIKSMKFPKFLSTY